MINECGSMPMSFMQMLASALFTDGSGNIVLNVECYSGSCDDLVPLVDCDTNQIDPERLVVSNAFGVDDCGNVALKLFINCT